MIVRTSVKKGITTRAGFIMNTFELQREQMRLAKKIVLNDDFDRIKTIGGVTCFAREQELIAAVVVCEYPSMKLLEKKTYVLPDPLPYMPGFQAYREMPAIMEAYNLLEEEPDVLLVKGSGILHPRKCGMASHLGLSLHKPTIGIMESHLVGTIDKGKIFLGTKLCGFEVKTREHAKPVYISPGHLMSLGSALNIIKNTIQYPHKMPEPLHIAHKIARGKAKEVRGNTQEKNEKQSNHNKQQEEIIVEHHEN